MLPRPPPPPPAAARRRRRLDQDPLSGDLRPYEAHTPHAGSTPRKSTPRCRPGVGQGADEPDGGGCGGAGEGSGIGGCGGGGVGGEADPADFEFDIPLEHIRMRDGSFESDVPVQVWRRVWGGAGARC